MKFKKRAEDVKILRSMSNDADLSINRNLWSLKTVRFIKSEELELLNALIMSSEWVKKILDIGTTFFDNMLVRLKIMLSFKNVKFTYRKPRHVTDWMVFYSETMMKNLEDFNQFCQNYLVFLQDMRLVNWQYRNFKETPLCLFHKKNGEINMPKITENSSEKELEVYCKWVLQEMLEVKTCVKRATCILEKVKKPIDKECERVDELHGSLEILMGTPDFDVFTRTLTIARNVYLRLLLTCEEDGTDPKEDGESYALKKARVYYDFI